jgi:hypothetical protein
MWGVPERHSLGTETGELETMRTRLPRWSWVGVLALALLAGCGEGKDREYGNLKKEAAETWDAAKAWGSAKRAEAERVFASSMDSLSKSYEASKAKAAAAGGDAAKTLEAKWADVQQKLTEMKGATGETWEKSRDAFVAAYEAFKREMASGK